MQRCSIDLDVKRIFGGFIGIEHSCPDKIPECTDIKKYKGHFTVIDTGFFQSFI
jgi:hypothetical protein